MSRACFNVDPARDGPDSVGPRQSLAQGPVPVDVRDEKADVHRLAVFRIAQRDGRAAAEKASVGAEQVGVQRFQDDRHAAVMLSLKQEAVLRDAGINRRRP